MITEEENRLLCQVEGNAPMGQLMRRHWIPALMSEEVEIDGKPVRVRLLGEDLVAFRDSNGDVGLIDEFCPHRGPSLYFGRNENAASDAFITVGSSTRTATSPKCLLNRLKAK